MPATGHDDEATPMPVTGRKPEATPVEAQISDVRAELLGLMAVKPAAQFGQLEAGATPETSSDSELATRLALTEAELRGLNAMVDELRQSWDRFRPKDSRLNRAAYAGQNQDELRRDRDEWRWRAERLLADQQRGTWWRWHKRVAAALDAVTASYRELLANVEDKSRWREWQDESAG
jgi:hypothetical protein